MTPPTAPKEIIKVGQLELRVLLDAEDTAGSVAMFELIVPPGAKVPAPHYHVEVDEVVYGLEGLLTYTVDGQQVLIGPGERVFVPRGAVHHFTNVGSETTRSLVVLTPALIGAAYFRELADLLSAGGPPDPVKVADIMRRHGLVVSA